MPNGGPGPSARRRLAPLAFVAAAVAFVALAAVAVITGQPSRTPTAPTTGPTSSPDSSASSTPSTSSSVSAPPASGLAPTGSPAPPPGSPVSLVFLSQVDLAGEDPSPGGTYVIVSNVDASPADIGCWGIRTSLADLKIAAGTQVPADGAVRFLFDRGQVDNPDAIQLLDDTGLVIDATPLLHDTAGDDQLFSRSDGGWTLGRAPLPSPLIDGGFQNPDGC
jgi:hypothetical protein